ncbi:MAG: hypothetical protein ACM3TT_02480 [Syntrophothermus sp.]
MTHSLHRLGSMESLRGDYVWMMYQTKGINDSDIAEKAREIIAVAEACGTENWGDVKIGSAVAVPPEEIKKSLRKESRVRGVFTSRQQVVKFLKGVKEKDLGLSIIISGLLDEVLPACREADVQPHTINFSLGVWGKKELLPEDDVLAITTMCGHHMISPDFVQKMADAVRKGRLTPRQAAVKLAKFCPCGIFNQVRAEKILAEKGAGQVATGGNADSTVA